MPLVSDGSPTIALTGQVSAIRMSFVTHQDEARFWLFLRVSQALEPMRESKVVAVRRYRVHMKHLHYGSIVMAISDQLASTFQTAAHDFMTAGRSAVWAVSGYRDDRDEISIQLAVGPGIAFAITDTWLPDEREPSRYDADSIAYIDGEHEALEKEQLSEAVRNVLVYGRFDRRSMKDAGSWRFSGHPSVNDAHDPQSAVSSLNREGIDVVSVTESGAPGDSAWSNFYILGRYVDTHL